MKKLFVVTAFFCSLSIAAQTDFGLKAGLNYGDNGEVEFRDFSSAGEDVLYEEGETSIGYHFGVFARSYLTDSFFIRPEVVYTQTKSQYNFNNRETDYFVHKIDIPILFGLDVIGPLQIFGGPSFQYITDTEFGDIRMGTVEDEFTVGVQFGVGVQLKSLGLDVRYERGFTQNEAEVLDLDNTLGAQRIDTRPSQIILSLSLTL